MMRSRFIFSALCLSSASLLSACGTFFGDEGIFRSRQKDYLRAEPIPPIAIPEGIDTAPLPPMFNVPLVNANDEFGDDYDPDDIEIPRPKPMADKGEVRVKIQKLGEDRWIFLNASTAQVWPRTQNFMSEYELAVASSNAREGLIETDWLRFKTDEGTKSRYRVFIEKGIHPDTSEVRIVHVERPEEFAGEIPQWPEKSDNPEKEQWLLRELAGVLAESVDNKAASLLGQNVGGKEKVVFVPGAAEPTMRILLPSGRAWATVSHAVNKEGFVKWDGNSDNGVFYAGYSEFGKKRGFWGRMAFWRDNYIAPKEGPYPLDEVLQHLSPNAGSLLRILRKNLI